MKTVNIYTTKISNNSINAFTIYNDYIDITYINTDQNYVEHYEIQYSNIFKCLKFIFEYISITMHSCLVFRSISQIIDKTTINTNFRIKNNCLYSNTYSDLYLSFSNTVIDNNCKRIHSNAFLFSNIKSIILPNNIKQLDKYCFNQCLLLKTIDLSYTKIQHLGKKVFYLCTNLTQINYPITLLTINQNTIHSCFNLKCNTLPRFCKII